MPACCRYLEQLGYHVVAYGCTTCMGNAGPLDEALENAVVKNDLIACAVLSGNRNFEARVHQSLKANFLMSPPLVVAFALAGTVRIDTDRDPIGTGKDGKPVYLKDIWPSDAEIAAVLKFANDADKFRREYGDLAGAKQLWDAIPESKGAVFDYDPRSTYILEPPFFEGFDLKAGHREGRQRRARARHLRRLAHDRPHQPRRADQGRVTRRASG